MTLKLEQHLEYTESVDIFSTKFDSDIVISKRFSKSFALSNSMMRSCFSYTVPPPPLFKKTSYMYIVVFPPEKKS